MIVSARPGARRLSRRTHGQSLVEAALLLPVLIFIAVGGVTIDSFIQAQSQLQQAVNRAALVASREAFDPCSPTDAPGAVATTYPPRTGYRNNPPGYISSSATHPHGYQDVVDAFNSALTSTLFGAHNPVSAANLNDVSAPGNPPYTGEIVPVITCTTTRGDPLYPAASVRISTPLSGGPISAVSPDPNQPGTTDVGTWWSHNYNNPKLFYVPIAPANACGAVGTADDKGCFSMWRGGYVSVSYQVTLTKYWTPFFPSTTISASAGGLFDPFRQHTCPGGGPATNPQAC